MSRFKTELCNNLIELGECKYGDRCHYAHGAHELRQVSRRHPKYRTEKCKNFELTGKCPFGPRCSYVHQKPDLDSMIEQLTRYMNYTKAPKPDSDDDDTDCAMLRNASCSSISNALPSYDLFKSSDKDDHMSYIDDDEDKENQYGFIRKPDLKLLHSSKRNDLGPSIKPAPLSINTRSNQQVLVGQPRQELNTFTKPTPLAVSSRFLTGNSSNRSSHTNHVLSNKENPF